MNTSRRVVLFAGFFLGLCYIASAQNRGPVAPIPVNSAAGDSSPAPSPETLSMNYHVTFSGTSEGKPLGELSMLTCAPEISISGPLNSGMTPTSFTVTGSLKEEDGGLLLGYEIDINFPVTTSMVSSKPDGQVSSSFDYKKHSSHGMLRLKPGMPYEILKSAGVVYTVTISPAPTD